MIRQSRSDTVTHCQTWPNRQSISHRKEGNQSQSQPSPHTNDARQGQPAGCRHVSLCCEHGREFIHFTCECEQVFERSSVDSLHRVCFATESQESMTDDCKLATKRSNTRLPAVASARLQTNLNSSPKQYKRTQKMLSKDAPGQRSQHARTLEMERIAESLIKTGYASRF